MASRGRRDFERWHKREIGDGAVTRDKQNEVATGSDLARDPFEVVTGSIHKVETWRAKRFGVIRYKVEWRAWIFFMNSPD